MDSEFTICNPSITMETKTHKYYFESGWKHISFAFDADDFPLNNILKALAEINASDTLRELRFDDVYLYTIETDVGDFNFECNYQYQETRIDTSDGNVEGLKTINALLEKDGRFEKIEKAWQQQNKS